MASFTALSWAHFWLESILHSIECSSFCAQRFTLDIICMRIYFFTLSLMLYWSHLRNSSLYYAHVKAERERERVKEPVKSHHQSNCTLFFLLTLSLFFLVHLQFNIIHVTCSISFVKGDLLLKFHLALRRHERECSKSPSKNEFNCFSGEFIGHWCEGCRDDKSTERGREGERRDNLFAFLFITFTFD